MPLPTLHILSPFHTILEDSFSHCAFSGKARRFPKMMKPFGYKTILYANEGAVTEADETVVMHNTEEFWKHYPKQGPKEFHGSHAHYGTPAWAIFDGRLREALAKKLGPQDLILHPFGHAHRDLIRAFPHHSHIESGIGYVDAPFGAWRIYETSAWLHWHLGKWEKDHEKDRGMVKAYSFVVGNYFDLEEWPICPKEENKDYVLFLGRITSSKGTNTIAEMIRVMAEMKIKQKFVFAGQGDFDAEVMSLVMRDPKPDPTYIDVDYLGPVTGRARAKLVGQARCCILASQFIEPFAGSVVEAMLTGTPAIGPAFGAFRETIIDGVNGYTCITIGDWITAIQESKKLDRGTVAAISRGRFSLEACGAQYDKIFKILHDQYSTGWNTRHSYRIPSGMEQAGDIPITGEVDLPAASSIPLPAAPTESDVL